MKFSLTAAAAAVLCMSTATWAAGPEFNFSAFGTVGAVHSSDDNSDYTGDRFQPKGAGATRNWSTTPDTKLGGQLSAVFDQRWSAVVQVVSKHQYDNTFRPVIEWANVKFQATPEVSLRVGRIAVPSYLLSESRYVGYSYPWLRAPIEVYNVLAITSNDGADVTWRTRFGDANNTLQAYWGKTTAEVSDDSKVDADPSWGVNNSVEIGSLTLRAGYSSVKVDLTAPGLPLIAGLRQLAAGAAAVPVPAFQSVAAQALALAAKYKLEGMQLRAVSLGANYDPGNYFLMSEFVGLRGDGLLADSRSWYVSGGWRFGAFTPYVTYASTKAQFQTETIDATGAAPLAASAAALSWGVNAVLVSITPTQHTTSVGLRWDAMKNVALKTQYDRISVGANSYGSLRPIPGRTGDKSVNVFSVAADFVF